MFLVPVLSSLLSMFAFERGASTRAPRLRLSMPSVGGMIVAGLLVSAMLGGIPATADSQRTYLDLSHDTMRQQLAINDLEAASRTLSWIRRVNAKDDVAAVLSAELQLRRGNVALAAMSLIDIISGADTGQAAVLEAQRVLTDLGDGDYLAGVIVTDAMLDEASRRQNEPLPMLLPAEEGAFAYAVATVPQPDVDQMASLLAFAPTTPVIEMAKAAGRAPPVPIPGASAPGVTVETAALQTPVPTTPDGRPPALIDLVFEIRPIWNSISRCSRSSWRQMTLMASATLERVLLIDPRSKLAKVLLADVKLRKGDLIQARSILRTLLAEEDTPPEMAARAEAIAEEVESRLDPLSTQTRLALEWGNTQNAFGRAESDEILFLNLPITNTTPDKSDSYVSYEVGFDAVREFDRQTPTLLEAGIAVTGRDTAHRDLSDVRSMSARLSVTQRAAVTMSAGGFASMTRVNNKGFNRNAGIYAALVTPFGGDWEASQSLSLSRSTYAAYPGIANNTGRSERSAVAKFSLSRQFSKALVNLAVSAGRSKARNRVNDLKFTKSELTMAGMIGDFSVTGTLSRQWTRNDIADVFISPLPPKKRQDSRTVKLRYPRGSSLGTFYFIPYVRVSSTSTKSNIPNSRREGSEAAIGLETVF